VENANVCEEKCCSNERCKLWVFRQGDKVCHLKLNDDLTFHEESGHQTKIKIKINETPPAAPKGATPTPPTVTTPASPAANCNFHAEKQGFYDGKIIAKSTVENANVCEEKCCSNERCKLWVFRQGDKVCHLKLNDDLTFHEDSGHQTKIKIEIKATPTTPTVATPTSPTAETPPTAPKGATPTQPTGATPASPAATNGMQFQFDEQNSLALI